MVISRDETYPLLSGLGDVPVRFEEGANVDSLAAPEVSMDRPVESKLQGAPVEGAVDEEESDQQSGSNRRQAAASRRQPAVRARSQEQVGGWERGSQGSLPGRHDGRGRLRRVPGGRIGIGSGALCPGRDRVERSYCLARLRGRRNMQWLLSGWGRWDSVCRQAGCQSESISKSRLMPRLLGRT